MVTSPFCTVLSFVFVFFFHFSYHVIFCIGKCYSKGRFFFLFYFFLYFFFSFRLLLLFIVILFLVQATLFRPFHLSRHLRLFLISQDQVVGEKFFFFFYQLRSNFSFILSVFITSLLNSFPSFFC